MMILHSSVCTLRQSRVYTLEYNIIIFLHSLETPKPRCDDEAEVTGGL